MMFALRLELRIAVGMKSILSDGSPQGSAQEHIRRPVVASHESRDGHGCSRTVSQRARPRLWIFVGEHRCHGKGEHGVSAGERCVNRGLVEEIAIPVALSRALPCKN